MVLILGGAVLLVTSTTIVRVVNGFVQAQTSAENAQKAQTALTRIVRELTAGCSSVNVSQDGSTLTFVSPRYPRGQTISRSGTDLLLGSDVLVDGVSSFSVSTGSTPRTSVTLALRLGGTQNVTYRVTVFP